MVIYPAIDIKNGKCVRLLQGKFDRETVYYDNPVEAAMLWEKKGFKNIHIVDLDGSLEGKPKNYNLIKKIINSVDIPVQLGGGIRNQSYIDDLLEIGIERVIIGTIAIKNKKLLERLLKDYGDKIAVSIDVRNGFIAVEGWTDTSNIDSIEFASTLKNLGVKTLIYTDISRDGMMKGPNFDVYKKLVKNIDIDIIASGGVSNINDVKKLENIGVSGCIIGRALYNRKVEYKDLLDVSKGGRK